MPRSRAMQVNQGIYIRPFRSKGFVVVDGRSVSSIKKLIACHRIHLQQNMIAGTEFKGMTPSVSRSGKCNNILWRSDRCIRRELRSEVCMPHRMRERQKQNLKSVRIAEHRTRCHVHDSSTFGVEFAMSCLSSRACQR